MLLLLMPLPLVAFHHPYGAQHWQRTTQSPAVKLVACNYYSDEEKRQVALCIS